MSSSRVSGRRVVAAAIALAATVATTACTGGEGTGPAGAPEPSQSLLEPEEAPTLSVEPVTSSGRLVGRLPRKERRKVEGRVSALSVRWLDAAYLGGKYPRRSFRNSFAEFTPAARAAARDDLGRMSNARIGPRIDEVTPTRVGVRVDLLARDRRAVTATTHVDARFRTEGRADRVFRVAGRLMMMRHAGKWRVFAYDVARARVDGAAGRRAKSSESSRRNQKQRQKGGRR